MTFYRHPAFLPAVIFGLFGAFLALPLPAAITRKPTPARLVYRMCTGSFPCHACIDCAACQLCHVQGGKCGVCSRKP